MLSRLAFTVATLLPMVLHGQTSSVRGPQQQVDRAMAQAFLESMASDLRNLVTSQEAFFSDHNFYGKVLSTQDRNAVMIEPTQGVTLTLTYATAKGWTARAGHDWLGGLTCVIWMGSVPPSKMITTRLSRQYAKEEGRPFCDSVP